MTNTRCARLRWYKSSYSTAEEQSACVEAACMSQAVAVRDTKLTSSPIHEFAPTSWAVFTDTLKAEHRHA